MSEAPSVHKSIEVTWGETTYTVCTPDCPVCLNEEDEAQQRRTESRRPQPWDHLIMPETRLTLGDVFPQEQARVRRCMRQGVEIGSAGAFYVSVCENVLQRADKAAIKQDVAQMIAVYQEMREIEE